MIMGAQAPQSQPGLRGSVSGLGGAPLPGGSGLSAARIMFGRLGVPEHDMKRPDRRRRIGVEPPELARVAALVLSAVVGLGGAGSDATARRSS